jgi:profilin
MNTFLQEALLDTKHICHAAIIRRSDGIIKAQSLDFNLTKSELRQIEKAFENPRDARVNDFTLKIMSMQYRPIRVDEGALYAKKEMNGLIIARTKNFYILGTFVPDMIASIAVEAVEKLADYFRNKDK